MWVPIDVQYILYVNFAQIRYRLLKCDGTVFDLDRIAKVKFNITNGFLIVVSYYCSIHLTCLSCSNVMLQAIVALFNVFPKSKLFDRIEANVTFLNVSGSPGASQCPQESDYKQR